MSPTNAFALAVFNHVSDEEPGSATDGSSHLMIDETQFTGSDAVDFTGGILLDNQSSATVMEETLNGLVRDIKSTNDLLRIHTNAGTATTN